MKKNTYYKKLVARLTGLAMTRNEIEKIAADTMSEVFGKRWDENEGKMWFYEDSTSIVWGYYNECYKGKYTTLRDVQNYILDAII